MLVGVKTTDPATFAIMAMVFLFIDCVGVLVARMASCKS